MSSKIEWTDETWNPVTGCTKISPGCANCYAERMAKRLSANPGVYANFRYQDFQVATWEDRLSQPLRWKKPRMVFVCSMGDLFHTDVPWSFISRVFSVIAQTPHTYQVLTKRPRIMHDWQAWSGWLEPRVWLGTSAERQTELILREPVLMQTPAAVRFLSLEPMLGPMQIGTGWRWSSGAEVGNVDWIIIGCESGPNRRPMKLEWALDMVRQCQAAGVPVFVKQLDIGGKVSKNPDEWPEELRVREYPTPIVGGLVSSSWAPV